MLSRPLALGLVVTACVVAAGGGAYIATLQHARSDSAMAASQTPAPGTEAAPLAQTPGAAPPPAGQSVASSAGAPPAQPSPDDVPGQPLTRAESARPAPRAVDRSSSATRPRPSPQLGPPPTDGKAAGTGTREESPSHATPAPVGDQGSAAQKPGGALPAPLPVPVPAPELPQVKDQPRGEPEQAWQEVTVPADSVIGLQLETPLSSESARVEDRVDARVTRDVRVDGQVAIPAGTHAIGSVMGVERGGKIRDRSRLGIRFHTLVLPDASRLPLNTETVYREGEAPSASSSAKIGGGAIGGAIIGAILGGGKGAAIGTGIGAAGGAAATMAGDRRAVVLPAGTPLNVRTQSPVTLTVEK